MLIDLFPYAGLDLIESFRVSPDGASADGTVPYHPYQQENPNARSPIAQSQSVPHGEIPIPYRNLGNLYLISRSGDVTPTTRPIDVIGFALGIFFTCVFRLDLEGVCSKVVSLSLEKIGG